jgi:GGDEF domain-containing protein
VSSTTPNLLISALALQRFRAACEQLDLPPPTLLRRLPERGWLPLSDPLAWLRDTSGQELPPALRFQLGAATLQQWYHEAGGFTLCPSAVQVLRHHVSVGSYAQMVRGVPEQIGSLRLQSLDENSGLATVFSSTPFCREWERGMLQGALDAPGDLLFSDVAWDPARHLFLLRFVSEANRGHIPWALGEPEELKVWRLRNRVRQLEQHNLYLEARVQPEPSARGGGASSAWLDPLSGAAQEAHLAERLRLLAEQPLPPPICLIAFGMADPPGAEQLRRLGAAGQAMTRRDGLLARLGEHQLALLLRDIEVPAAERVAQRLRSD